MIPLYGFLQGDSMGLLILADPQDSMARLIEKTQAAATMRVAPREGLVVVVAGRPTDPDLTVAAAGLTALDKFEVVAPRA